MRRYACSGAEAAVFKSLSDPIRLRLAAIFALNGETCVCVLADALGEPESKVSRHLGIMRAAGVVAARREGTWMHYRLAPPRTRLEACLQRCLRDCLRDHGTVAADMRRLKKALTERRPK